MKKMVGLGWCWRWRGQCVGWDGAMRMGGKVYLSRVERVVFHRWNVGEGLAIWIPYLGSKSLPC